MISIGGDHMSILENFIVENGTIIGKRFSQSKWTIPSFSNNQQIISIGSGVWSCEYYDPECGEPDGQYCGDESLTSIEFAPGIKTIKAHAFHGCRNLKFVTIPRTLERIEDYAFAECTSLTLVDYWEDHHFAVKDLFEEQTKHHSSCLSYIGESAFFCCENLIGTDFMNKEMKYIGNGAFSLCTRFTFVRVPYCNSIGQGVFSTCLGLKGVVLDSRIKALPKDTFYACNRIEYIKTE